MKLEILICAFVAAFMMSGCVFGLSSEAQNPATVTVTVASPTPTAVYESTLVTKPPEATPVADSGTVEPTRIPSTVAAPENRIIWISQTKGSFDGGVAISADGRYVTFISDTMNPVPENQCVGFTGDPQPCTQVYVFDRVSNAFQLASAAVDGIPGNGHSGTWAEAGHHTAISGDGRFIAFASGATNLTPTLSECTLFVLDRVSRKTECVGRTANAGATSWYPTLSADGRFVAFNSDADDLVVNDTNDLWDVFVYDRQMGEMERISVASDGSEGNNISGHWFAPDISADGRFVVFVSWASNLVSDDTNDVSDIFIYDRETNQTKMVSVSDTGLPANGPNVNAVISANGQFVAYESEASNLLPDDTNNMSDIFVYDLQTDALQRVSLGEEGEQSDGLSRTPSISANGRFIAFASRARNLVAGDTNLKEDVFVYDRQTRQITRVSVNELGVESNGHSKAPEISADGEWISFVSEADNLVYDDFNQTWDVFALELNHLLPSLTSAVQLGPIEWISRAADGTPGNGSSEAPSLSADGRFVAFTSSASNLVPNDTNGKEDVFVHDRQTGETTRVSVSSDGTQSNGEDSGGVSLSADGHFVLFTSNASNLVLGDGNGRYDIFLHDRQTSQTIRLSLTEAGQEPNGDYFVQALSADGCTLAFAGPDSNLMPNDSNERWNVFVRDLCK